MGATQRKGNLGLVKAIAELVGNEIGVSLPISESDRYDLIAEKNNICKTVQVRYTKTDKDGQICVKLKSVWSNSQGYHVRNREKSDYDILAVYCPDSDEVYYLDATKFNNGNAITLRLTEPIKISKPVWMAKDFRDCKVFWKED